jgi:protein-tyrosine-phosphatase
MSEHKVLFVDVGNSTLGPMAKAFARHYGIDADTVGTMPAHEISAPVLVALKEKGIPADGLSPRRIDFLRLADYERIIALGDGVAQTSPDLHAHETWPMDDPVNLDYVLYRKARDEIEHRVKELADEIKAWSEPEAPAHS